MKTLLVAMSCAAAIGCGSTKEIQVEMVRAELVRIDTVFRRPDTKQQLTWKDQDNIRYISFAAMDQTFPLGISMVVMRTR
jgi:hypothetical protein